MAGPIKRGVEQLTALLTDIRAGKGTVGKLFTDEQVYMEFNALLTSAERVAAGINRGQGRSAGWRATRARIASSMRRSPT